MERRFGLQISSKLRAFEFPFIRFPSMRPFCVYSNLLAWKDSDSIAIALSLAEKSRSCLLGSQIHAKIVTLGLVNDAFLQNNLIKMYGKCGVLGSVTQVFDEMPERNLVTWTLMVSSLVQNGENSLALEFYLGMVRTGCRLNSFGFGSVVKACTNIGAYQFGMSVHGLALKLGIDKDFYVGGSMLNMYAKLKDIESAVTVFDSMPNLDVGCWNAMIGGYVKCGLGFKAVNTVCLMIRCGLSVDEFTFINSLKGCSDFGSVDCLKQIHGLIIKADMESSTSLMNCLVDVYFQLGLKDFALKVFDRIVTKDVISWNTRFSYHFEEKDGKEFARLFREFIVRGFKPNRVTFSVLFRQCGESRELDLGSQLCCLAIKFGLDNEINISNSIIHMFLNCCHVEGLRVFASLHSSGLKPNEFTFTSVLEACSEPQSQRVFRHIHGAIIKYGFSSEEFVCSSLINGYVKYGLVGDSFRFFDGLDRLDFVCWATMISAMFRQGNIYEGIRFLKILIETGEKPDHFILGSVLNYCANASCYRLTQALHSLATKTGFETQVFVASGLIDAYAKCGDIDAADLAFVASFQSRDVVMFNTMITGYAHHGLVSKATGIFESMKLANLKPNQATFVSLISACNHKGLVDKGLNFFNVMVSDYEMEPRRDVYCCVVDMVARNGRLEKAREIIEAMPYEPWPEMLRALLNGCKIHGDAAIGEWAAERLARLAPRDGASYVLLSEIYSEIGGWIDAGKIRECMVEKGVSKETGYSWIEV